MDSMNSFTYSGKNGMKSHSALLSGSRNGWLSVVANAKAMNSVQQNF
jgi:hypothetical protein